MKPDFATLGPVPRQPGTAMLMAVHHDLNNAQIELAAHERAVTDWARFRGFERL
jgi:hypothetical protein